MFFPFRPQRTPYIAVSFCCSVAIAFFPFRDQRPKIGLPPTKRAHRKNGLMLYLPSVVFWTESRTEHMSCTSTPRKYHSISYLRREPEILFSWQHRFYHHSEISRSFHTSIVFREGENERSLRRCSSNDGPILCLSTTRENAHSSSFWGDERKRQQKQSISDCFQPGSSEGQKGPPPPSMERER